MTSLHELVEQVEADDLAPTDRLRRIALLERAVVALKVQVVATLDGATLVADGARSAADWLIKRTGAHPGDAAIVDRVGDALPAMPVVAAGLAAGTLSLHKADLLAGVAGLDGFADAEADLTAHVSRVTWKTAQGLVRQFRSAHTEPDPVAYVPSTATIHQGKDKRWMFTADLTEADGHRLNLELSRLLAELRSEKIPFGQRVAAALMQAMRRSTSLGDRPVGARPEVVVVVREDEVTVDGDVVRPETADLFRCDATMRRAVLTAEGEILDLGRSVRLFKPGQRRWFEVRDKGCTMPGCDAPPSWCEAHHPEHWDCDGESNEDNGLLRCHRCHAIDHVRKYTEYIRDDLLLHHHPDGRIEVVGPAPSFDLAA